MMNKINPALRERLETLISSMGYEFVGCETALQGRLVVFRVYIDGLAENGHKGVTVEDCTLVSRQVSAMLDVEDPFQARYSLEVSSPGIDRPLFELAHYQRFVGSTVKIKLHLPINKRRQFKGILKCVLGEDIHLLVDGLEQVVVLPFAAIEKANLIGDVRL